MDEDGWLTGVDSGKMLDPFLRQASPRKLRLYAAACVRRVILPSHPSDWTAVVEAVERWADGENIDSTTTVRAQYQGSACVSLINTSPFHAARAAANQTTLRDGESSDAGRLAQCGLLRCVFGNPFHSVTIDAAWISSTVSDLATAAYDERILPSGELETARLAVLSDALNEAGCDNADILAHLRSPGPHVRGCWVIDLILGKE